MSNDVTDPGAPGYASEAEPGAGDERPVSVGAYTWRDFMVEFGYEDEIPIAYQDVDTGGTGTGLFSGSASRKRQPDETDWARTDFAPEVYLGFPPEAMPDRLGSAAGRATALHDWFTSRVANAPVVKDVYTWEHFKWEHYYDEAGQPPRDRDGSVVPFDPAAYLGFPPEEIESRLAAAAGAAARLAAIEEERTVYVNPELDEDAFFSTVEGHTTLVNRYDLEKAVPMDKKRHFVEVDRYWVNKPYAFVIVFHSVKENEKKYYVIEPYLNAIESDLVEYLSGKLRTSIKYSDDDVVVEGSDEERGQVLVDEIEWLLDRHDLRKPPTTGRGSGTLREQLAALQWSDLRDRLVDVDGLVAELKRFVGRQDEADGRIEPRGELDGIAARPEPAVLAENAGWLTEYQIEKLFHVIRRDFIGYERIDAIKHDINVEDISCDGYDSPVFVYHTDYENLITNVQHGRRRLDNFVVKLAQRSGKGISKRQPQVDATLPDGSRAQLTLGTDVSDHGTNYTIRQFKDVPFTPVDLINWKTFSMDEMAFLWLCIESNKSLIFAGGTASGKTTSLNAVSLFIPSNTKIVSIEDTREVELPQRNWIASVTRPSFSQDNTGNVDEFDLLEAALRQRPDYIIMGEVRGEEGRTLFQVMSTGHTTYTTFHADDVNEVVKRFTTDPINVSKTLFTALDFVSVQTQTKVHGRKVRRNKLITEINSYDAENDEISVQDIFQWQPEHDEYLQHPDSKKLRQIAFERGWSEDRLAEELFVRQVVLSYLIRHGLNTYTDVAATVQAFINDPDTVLTLIANDELEDRLEDLREMESMLIDVDPEVERLVPRPEPDEAILDRTAAVLDAAVEGVLGEFRGRKAGSLVDALATGTWADDIVLPAGLDEGSLAAIVGNRPTRSAAENGLGVERRDPDGVDRAAGGDDAPRGAREDADGDADGSSAGGSDAPDAPGDDDPEGGS